MIAALVAMLLLVGLSLGLVTGALGSVARDGLYATGLWRDGGRRTIAPGTFDTPAAVSPSPEPVGQPSPVLPAASPTERPLPKKIVAKVDSVDRSAMKGRFSGAVVDVGNGRVLYAHNSRSAYTPASTLKLLTSTAALTSLGPDHRFRTRVVAGKSGQIVLVGGGDPYLAEKTDPNAYPARASLQQLAAATAKALRTQHRTSVRLGYDASLFKGPSWNAHWPEMYRDQVTRVSALWVDEGRQLGYSPGPREPDPARDAADAFAKALRANKIKVTGVAKAKAHAGAASLASVQSMPLGRIVEQVLLHSDNDGAEVLLRQAAIGAGRPGSFTEGRRTVQRELTRLGVWDKGIVGYDGSGLSREDKVPADTMVKILRLASEDAHPELRSLLTGLPVAGVDGSLRLRFTDSRSVDGRGLVRGKTGTLRKVHSMAGYVRTQDGAVLAFAFLVNDPANDYAARVWLDRVSAALATCGCG
ncbi:D-alanyl-D-alanine carboxypeptidase/D-alanyl-D-alanine-endopeptidase [Microlunatus panaciterrae]